MTSSTNNEIQQTAEPIGGAFADALTLVRLLLTPVIMFVIYKAWTQPYDTAAPAGQVPVALDPISVPLILLATCLFAIAAFTDLLDDFIGGSAGTNSRQWGWFDDIADSILIAGTLLMLMFVTYRAGMLTWMFAIPALLLIVRDVVVATIKGYELSKFGFLETRLGDVKNLLAMLATCLLVAAPWLTNIVQNLRANEDNVLAVYENGSTIVWTSGLVTLWIAAILALFTGFKLLTSKPDMDALAAKDDTANE